VDPGRHLDLRRQVTELTAQLAANALTAEEHAAKMEEESRIAEDLIAELRGEGVLDREEIAHLRQAVLAARTIGAAVGILMVNRGVSQETAFDILREASSRSERKLRDVAAGVVATTDQGQT